MNVKPLNLARLPDYPLVGIDTETTGLHWYKDKVFGIAVAAHDPKAGEWAADYFDVRTDVGQRKLAHLAKVAPQCKLMINHAAKFDAHMLREAGVRVPADIQCTEVREALIDEHQFVYNLDAVGKRRIGKGKVEIYEDLAGLFGGKGTRSAQIGNLHRAPESLARKYAIQDPILAIELWLWQEEEIKRQELERVWDLERKLTPILVDIESQGVRVDEELAAAQLKVLEAAVYKRQKALNKLYGKEVNVNSPPQMRAMFGAVKTETGEGDDKRIEWRTDAGFLLENTEGGEASMSKDSLVTMEGLGDPRAAHVIYIRKMTKAQQFLKDHIIGHAHGGRVYPNYNQTRGQNDLGTKTGRFSIDDPALQQIPARDVDVAAIVRACFLPERGEDWGCADWEQFEFRWFAHYTNDPNINAAYLADPKTDYHQIVAAITGIPRKPRFAGDANAKQINLGLVFGMGEGELAYQMGLDFTVRRQGKRDWKNAGPKAKQIFETYHSSIPGVRKILNQAMGIARARGYVETKMGRHIRFPHGQATYKAGGLVFQGTSADCMKQKMIEMHPISKKEGFRILLSVHDELDFSFPKKRSAKLAAMVKKELETFDGERCPIKCRIPILSSVAVGPNWWEGSK